MNYRYSKWELKDKRGSILRSGLTLVGKTIEQDCTKYEFVIPPPAISNEEILTIECPFEVNIVYEFPEDDNRPESIYHQEGKYWE